MHALPIILGPTASGKTALAVETALRLRDRLGAESAVISADSMQIYRGMDIGSAKPTIDERRGVVHQMIDVVEPTEPFTVSDWLAGADRHIDRLQRAGGAPVVAGGTHLYIKALLDGMFEGPPGDIAIRERLHALGREALRARLQHVDPAAASRIHANDLRRTVRALEVYEMTGTPISEHQRQWDRGRLRRATLLVPILWETEALNRRINARVREMLDAGLLDEVRALHEAGRLGAQAREGIGYAQLADYLEGRSTLDDAIERIKIDSRRLAKSQRTWMRRLLASGESLALEGAGLDPAEGARRIVERLLAEG